jgi:hypothetical protein
MTKRKTNAVQREVATETPVTIAESKYSAKELVENYKVFNASYAIVAVALRLAGKDSYTFEEAKTIIDTFKNKEVK